MKKRLITYLLHTIERNNSHIDNVKMEEIGYGLEGLYMMITKFIIVFLIAFAFGINNEFIVFFIIYNIIRFFAFGLHAKSTKICLIMSITILISIPFLATILFIPFYIKIILSFFCLFVFILYAPADTHQRPIISVRKRRKLKIASSLVALIYIVIIAYVHIGFWANIFFMALMIESLLIMPITYKIFKVPYGNYKDYM